MPASYTHESVPSPETTRARWRLRVAVSSALAVCLLSCAPACGQSASLDEARESRAPAQPSLGDLIEQLSEPGGYFDTDNLISNERSYAQIVERLAPSGGVYLGVGPEQNFNYIGRTRPSWAFIVDVRRDNMLHHLLLNVVLSSSPTPFSYLCHLFSRPCSDSESPTSDIPGMLEQLARFPPSEDLFRESSSSTFAHIESDLGVTLSDADRERLTDIYSEFFRSQLQLRFRSHGRPMSRRYPSYEELLLERTPSGEWANFLSRPEDYAHVRDLARRGRLVPVVGDFSGPKALRAVGAFIAQQGEAVSTFYTSNVEYYLLADGRFDNYAENVSTLPIAKNGLFVRAYFDYGKGHPDRLPGYRSTMVLQRIARFLELQKGGAYRSYWDLCTRDYLPRPRVARPEP